jgi:hypothetical protein
MTDITHRLRALYVQYGIDYVQEAAEEIQRLRIALDRYDPEGVKMREMVEDYIRSSSWWQMAYDSGDDLPEINSMSNRDLIELFAYVVRWHR